MGERNLCDDLISVSGHPPGSTPLDGAASSPGAAAHLIDASPPLAIGELHAHGHRSAALDVHPPTPAGSPGPRGRPGHPPSRAPRPRHVRTHRNRRTVGERTRHQRLPALLGAVLPPHSRQPAAAGSGSGSGIPNRTSPPPSSGARRLRRNWPNAGGGCISSRSTRRAGAATRCAAGSPGREGRCSGWNASANRRTTVGSGSEVHPDRGLASLRYG